jgi:hypothetical protein
MNFKKLGLKRLICTSFGVGDDDNRGTGYVLDVENFCPNTNEITEEFINNFLNTHQVVKKLNGNGDFRSVECIEYLKLADIIVTNPPFSLFREFVSTIMHYKKKILIIGSLLALTHKEIFPLMQNNEIWIGYHFGKMEFRVPASSEPRNTEYWMDETGQKWRRVGNIMWLTNLEIERKPQPLILTKRYNPIDYPKYDTYDAINVKRVADIPYDYTGIMGVPITIINKYNSSQFEIVGEAIHGSDNEYDLFKPIIGGKELFPRILIKHKSQNAQGI